MSCSSAAALVTVTEYRQLRERIFPSDGPLQWYLRQQRKALIESGALLLIAGRHFIHPEKFDACVISAGQVAAQRQAGEDA